MFKIDPRTMKDCIEEFEVELDLEDRSRLYDYANCQDVIRQDGEEWKKDHLKGLGTLDPMKAAEEDLNLQIRAMDSMINDTGLLQKTLNAKNNYAVSESVFHSDFAAFQSVVDVPRRVLPVYVPGDVVRGSVVLKLNKPIQADALSINFVGQATVSIRVYRDGGYHDDVTNEKYADETELLWERIGRRGSRADSLADDFSELLVADVDAADPKMGQSIREGLHRWPFEFTIPFCTAQSTPNLRPGSHHYCFVVYRLKAKLDAGKTLRRGNIVVHKGLWVRKAYDIGPEIENFQSFTSEETLETGMLIKSGRITIKATLPQRAFVKGEDIPVAIEILNHSSGAIDCVWAAICLQGRFRLVESKVCISKNVCVKGEKKYMENLGAGMCPTMNWRLRWNFSRSSVDTNLMPVGEMQNDCKMIEVNYAVVIKAKRGAIHRNLELSIPILIGSENSKQSK